MPNVMELQRLVVRLVADASQWDKGFIQADSAINRLSRKTVALGKTLTVGATVPLTTFGAVSVKAFSDFDQAMTESTSIMDGMTKDVETAMAAQAKALSGQGPQSAAELAKSYFFLASAGLDAKRSMEALPAVQSFATAGAFDMALATDLLTDAQTAMGLSSKDGAKNLMNLKRCLLYTSPSPRD